MSFAHLFLLLLTILHTPDVAKPRGELIFPPMAKHNHGSCIVECPNGDLLACWYRGSGEKSADDVAIYGARRKRGQTSWSEAFVMADTPGFPDCNPCMVVDAKRRLWLFYPTILANLWESAITKYKISRDYQRPGSPKWEVSEDLPLKPGPEFTAAVDRDLPTVWGPYAALAPATFAQRMNELKASARDKLKTRLGWMPRVHPYLLDSGRLILPLYSDGFDFSLMAITDDGGVTWKCSEPLVGPANVQPSIVKRKDGSLVAYFRNNGPPPHKILVSESRDQGMTWTLSKDIDLPNPGSGLEATVLNSGRWLLVGNDSVKSRESLAVWVSEDEGKTWPIVRHLEHDAPIRGSGSYSYPSIIQARDGLIHVTYSFKAGSDRSATIGKGESIRHVQFTEAWLLEGDRPQ